MHINNLAFLRLMQLADSALPIGSTAHSWGLETLTVEETLSVEQLESFFHDYLQEIGRAESIFCRLGYSVAMCYDEADFTERWLALNAHVSALKMARESRTASAMLGRRLLQLLFNMQEEQRIALALESSKMHKSEIHYSVAFGLAGSILGIDEAATVLAYLQQTLLGLVSACQRLLPLGQNQASRIVWRLKATLIDVAQHSEGSPLNIDDVALFTPLIDLGGMRHPTLTTRLFIS